MSRASNRKGRTLVTLGSCFLILPFSNNQNLNPNIHSCPSLPPRVLTVSVSRRLHIFLKGHSSIQLSKPPSMQARTRPPRVLSGMVAPHTNACPSHLGRHVCPLRTAGLKIKPKLPNQVHKALPNNSLPLLQPHPHPPQQPQRILTAHLYSSLFPSPKFLLHFNFAPQQTAQDERSTLPPSSHNSSAHLSNFYTVMTSTSPSVFASLI